MPKCLFNTIRRQRTNPNDCYADSVVEGVTGSIDGSDSSDCSSTGTTTRPARCSRQRGTVKRKPSLNHLSVVTRFYMHTESERGREERHKEKPEENWSEVDHTSLLSYSDNNVVPNTQLPQAEDVRFDVDKSIHTGRDLKPRPSRPKRLHAGEHGRNRAKSEFSRTTGSQRGAKTTPRDRASTKCLNKASLPLSDVTQQCPGTILSSPVHQTPVVLFEACSDQAQEFVVPSGRPALRHDTVSSGLVTLSVPMTSTETLHGSLQQGERKALEYPQNTGSGLPYVFTSGFIVGNHIVPVALMQPLWPPNHPTFHSSSMLSTLANFTQSKATPSQLSQVAAESHPQNSGHSVSAEMQLPLNKVEPCPVSRAASLPLTRAALVSPSARNADTCYCSANDKTHKDKHEDPSDTRRSELSLNQDMSPHSVLKKNTYPMIGEPYPAVSQEVSQITTTYTSSDETVMATASVPKTDNVTLRAATETAGLEITDGNGRSSKDFEVSSTKQPESYQDIFDEASKDSPTVISKASKSSLMLQSLGLFASRLAETSPTLAHQRTVTSAISKATDYCPIDLAPYEHSRISSLPLSSSENSTNAMNSPGIAKKRRYESHHSEAQSVPKVPSPCESDIALSSSAVYPENPSTVVSNKGRIDGMQSCNAYKISNTGSVSSLEQNSHQEVEQSHVDIGDKVVAAENKKKETLTETDEQTSTVTGYENKSCAAILKGRQNIAMTGQPEIKATARRDEHDSKDIYCRMSEASAHQDKADIKERYCSVSEENDDINDRYCSMSEVTAHQDKDITDKYCSKSEVTAHQDKGITDKYCSMSEVTAHQDKDITDKYCSMSEVTAYQDKGITDKYCSKSEVTAHQDKDDIKEIFCSMSEENGDINDRYCNMSEVTAHQDNDDINYGCCSTSEATMHHGKGDIIMSEQENNSVSEVDGRVKHIETIAFTHVQDCKADESHGGLHVKQRENSCISEQPICAQMGHQGTEEQYISTIEQQETYVPNVQFNNSTLMQHLSHTAERHGSSASAEHENRPVRNKPDENVPRCPTSSGQPNLSAYSSKWISAVAACISAQQSPFSVFPLPMSAVLAPVNHCASSTSGPFPFTPTFSAQAVRSPLSNLSNKGRPISSTVDPTATKSRRCHGKTKEKSAVVCTASSMSNLLMSSSGYRRTGSQVSYCRDARQDALLFYPPTNRFGAEGAAKRCLHPLGDRKGEAASHRCSVCSVEFASLPDLHFHMSAHKNTNRGGASFGDGCGSAERGSQADTDAGEARNKCGVCSRVFTRSWLLKGHMRTHTGERPFRCTWPQCQRAFADKSNLRSHTLIHTTTAKSFSCPKCSRAFSQKRYLHKHMLEVCRII